MTEYQFGSIITRARLPQLYKDLQDDQSSGTDRLQHTAWEKRQVGKSRLFTVGKSPQCLRSESRITCKQEAYVYSKTGARFYDTLNCPDTPQRPKVYNVSGAINSLIQGGSTVIMLFLPLTCR